MSNKNINTNSEFNLEEIVTYISEKNLEIDILNTNLDNLNKEVESLISQGKTNSAELIQTTKNISKLTELTNQINILKTAIESYQSSETLLKDSDFEEMAKDDMENQKQLILDSFFVIKKLTQKPLKFDSNRAIVEFRPGVGGLEASLFAEELFRAYSRFASENGLQPEQVSIDYDSDGGIKEASIILNAPDSYGYIRFESGVHRVQRVPVTESSGRIHTSSASVTVLPQIEESEVKIDPTTLRIDVYRSSGPGGQSVNTTDSAVRITHLPTNIVVSCQSGKSQHQNKHMAMQLLLSKLVEREEEKKQSEENKIRSGSIGGGDRSAKIRTYNFPQGRITDHRINQSWFNISGFLNGEMKDILETVSLEMRKTLE